MGLTKNSLSKNAIDNCALDLKRESGNIVVAFAGNPNVGKSTLFNNLTGMKQHTGNWPGKTVSNAIGYCKVKDKNYTVVDIPGTYSLLANSPEEEVARDFLIHSKPDITVVVCDATCIERNLNLVLQILEITKNVIVCINLIDEAKRRGITVDFKLLQERLSVPVIFTNGHQKRSKNTILQALENFESDEKGFIIKYDERIENAVAFLFATLSDLGVNSLNKRWLSLRLIEGEKTITSKIYNSLNENQIHRLRDTVHIVKDIYKLKNNYDFDLKESMVSSIYRNSEQICDGAIHYENKNYSRRERKIDRILTNKITGIPIMVLLLLLIFWITISFSNYPSRLLSDLLFAIENKLNAFCDFINCPKIISSMLLDGVFHVVAWVVSVMLPPMAIFFPIFTVLEDSGFLPRLAYNLDLPFKKCNSCGKQALTMCMGFGCNAAGVVGCRIINSPKERLLSILTNNFVPCNGRFPALIAIISMFLVYGSNSLSNFLSALILTAFIVFSIIITLITTKTLSATVLKGVESSYTLELPPYRRPQILKTIYRSIFDRTLFVLGRAVAVAAPTGLIIWLLNNVSVGDVSLLIYISQILNSIANYIGLDGAILIAFILGFPANEIVLPIIVMIYNSQNQLTEISNIDTMKTVLLSNGWTLKTALCVLAFYICHWPCSTTLLTIKKETKSLKWTAVAFCLPTFVGIVICFLINVLL